MFSFDPELAKELAERMKDLESDDILRKVLFKTQDHLVQVSKNYFDIMLEKKALESKVEDQDKRIQDLTEKLAQSTQNLDMETMCKLHLEERVNDLQQRVNDLQQRVNEEERMQNAPPRRKAKK